VTVGRGEGVPPTDRTKGTLQESWRARASLLIHDRRRGRIYSLMAIGVFGLVFGGAILRSAIIGDPQFGVDFSSYWLAAGQLAGGHSPYPPAMLAGPYPAQGFGAFRYPPLLGQLAIPLSYLPLTAAKVVWLGLQIATLAAALWISSAAGGARNVLDRALSVGLAFTVFTPVFAGLLQGNIEGPIALLIAVALIAGEGAAGAALAGGALIKIVPGLALPALAARGRRGVAAFLGAAVVLVVPSMLLSPGAWRDFAVVLPNMLEGSAAYRNNLAVAGALGADPSLAQLELPAALSRVLFIGAAVCLGVLSIWLARRRGGWPAALFAATMAATLAPAAIWYHYTVVLLPFAFYAWPHASERMRVGMLVGLAGFILAVGWPILITIPAFAIFTWSCLRALWPPSVAERETGSIATVPSLT
jgi:hypothetical protein